MARRPYVRRIAAAQDERDQVCGGEGKAHPISMGEFELKQQAKAKAEAEASFGGVKKPGSRRSSKSKSKSKVKKKVPKHLRNN